MATRKSTNRKKSAAARTSKTNPDTVAREFTCSAPTSGGGSVSTTCNLDGIKSCKAIVKLAAAL
jgi:hypothetical protein